MFKGLYGILAPLVRTERLAINIMDLRRLNEVFEPKVAGKIRDARPTGFKSRSDFKGQTAGEQDIGDDVLNNCDF